MMKKRNNKLAWMSVLLVMAFTVLVLHLPMAAQDDQDDPQDDPPGRAARLAYAEGSVSFQPAGETEWVEAVVNRPMTTGDQVWADKDSRAEIQVGSSVIRMAENTGFSFLNLDDNTTQIQLTAGALNVRVRELGQDEVFEIDTPNQAFSVHQPGSYRVEASEDGTYTVVSVRDGDGESTGNGQTYNLHAGQQGTFSGTDSLNADVVNIEAPDQFDNWANDRDHRYDNSRSASYVSHDVVGYQDLDDNGDWRDDSNYGHVWYPNRVSADWAPYHDGHWDWVAPWGWTWVDDASWGYAPFHYGRWVSVSGRWGWIAGPVNVRPVYAPALVVFVGGGPGGFGGNVGWFPLGPREVYVPSYRVSRGYVNRVNISNTTVNTTTITNVYNTTIINKTTNVTNVTYVNRNVRGAVTAVPQRSFVSAQPVARAAVRVDARQLAAMPVNARVSVAPTRESVLGARANTAGRVTAPPAAVASRQVIAKKTPPPPPVSFARQQQAMAKNPGQPLGKREVATLRPANNPAAAHPQVKVAPAGKPATPNGVRPATQPNRPAGQPGNQPAANRPGQPGNPPANNPGIQPANQPGNRPGNPPGNQPGNPAANRPGNQPAPGERPGANPAQPNRPDNNRPEENRPQPNQPDNNRPVPNRPQPNQPDNSRPAPNRPQPNQPDNNRPEPNRPQPNQPDNNRPEPNRPQPNRPDTNRLEPNRPQPNQPDNNRPAPNRPQPNQPETNRPEPNRSEPNRPDTNRPDTNRPQPNRPDANRPDTNRPQPNRPDTTRPADKPERNDRPPAARPRTTPSETRPAPNQRPQPKPQTPEEKKREQEKQKEQDKPKGE